jgi:hypothetical protein
LLEVTEKSSPRYSQFVGIVVFAALLSTLALALRGRWEYSHAASAVLNLAAFIAASLAVTWSCNAW